MCYIWNLLFVVNYPGVCLGGTPFHYAVSTLLLFLEFALFGMCPFWNVLFLEYALFKMSPGYLDIFCHFNFCHDKGNGFSLLN